MKVIRAILAMPFIGIGLMFALVAAAALVAAQALIDPMDRRGPWL